MPAENFFLEQSSSWYADAASHIHPYMGDWEEVMFRFSDVNTIRVIYNRKAGAPNRDKTEFDKFLMGTTYNTHKNIYGFYKYSPADHNKRNPSSGFVTISKLHFYSNSGVSELHAGSDKWINMWNNVDGSSHKYVTSDDGRARGTKCIAGYCYLNKPIWVMVGKEHEGEKGEQGLFKVSEGTNAVKGNKGERGPKGKGGMNGLKGVRGEQGFHGKDGINRTKGPGKDETVPAGKSPQDAIKFGDTAEKCTQRISGTGSANGTPQNKCGKTDPKECCYCHDGIQGPQGVQGFQGPQGVQGFQGPQGVRGKDGCNGRDGRNGAKGQKGDTGPPGKSPQGAIKFGDTAEKCTQRTAGTVRYNASQSALQLCDGSKWLLLMTGGKGHVASRPGRHCMDILKSGGSRGSGLYWIDPNGGSTDDSFQAFCDMETEGGGWTLVATKVSPTFLFIKTTFSTSAAKTADADAASHIHPDMGDWEEVMFRFSDISTIRVIYNRKAGAPNNDKTEFDKFLMGRTYHKARNINGFYKYSPKDHNKRNPSSSFVTIVRLHFASKYGISEAHEGTDKWIDIWSLVDRLSNKYVTSDDSRALGTKCIAGYCYLNKPIWVMVR
ncbi:Collagen alpha-1(VII) chain [Stylophora pistillata]|uniref:Collagen alpha-1(VII) chain n=1 Tax=Stylophora pistillata TaxID=50429 RepID=A0A2B4SFP2_STYPI|nr:Collagen alpha-1(VII) chain [Stylophora pistillata]